MKHTDEKVPRITVVAMVLLATLLTAACTTGGGSRFRAAQDADDSVPNHPATEWQIADAMLHGKIVTGSIADKVRATAGRPILRSVFDGAGGSEAWLLPTSILRLNHFAAHNAPMLRIIFRNGRVVAVKPLL